MTSVDVLVLGGGPAGSSAAIWLTTAGASVALVERSAYQTFRIGETLPPEAVVLLARLGLAGVLDADGHTPAPGTVAAWGSSEPRENDFVFSPYGHGWHLDRRRFDQRLSRTAAESGADILSNATAVACEQGDAAGWQVVLKSPGGLVEIAARWVIDATGRASWFAHRQGARRRVHATLIGTVGVFHEKTDPDPRTFIEATPDGWWYSSAIPDHRAVAVYFSDAIPERWDEALGATVLTRHRMKDALRVGGLRQVAASSTRLDRVAGTGWLAAGDAACTLDPLSSQGICWALGSGIEAAGVILEGGNTESAARYADRVAARFEDYLHTRSDFYAQEQRWPDSAFWRRQSEGEQVPVRSQV